MNRSLPPSKLIAVIEDRVLTFAKVSERLRRGSGHRHMSFSLNAVLNSFVIDFLPRVHKGSTKTNLPWLVRRAEVDCFYCAL